MFEPRLMASARVEELTADGYTPVVGGARPAPAPPSPARMRRIADNQKTTASKGSAAAYTNSSAEESEKEEVSE